MYWYDYIHVSSGNNSKGRRIIAGRHFFLIYLQWYKEPSDAINF